MKLVLATRNRGKVREIGEMLREAKSRMPGRKDQRNLELLSLFDYPEAPAVIEDGMTYEENAIKKAATIAQHTGHLTLADDSGLEVDALDGAPGVHSARYAGENASDAERIAKLLDALQEVADEQRTARFKCAVAIATPVRQTKVVVGVCEGRIIRNPRGVQGFGYDPVFVPVGYDKTFAELGKTVKNRISHRAKALTIAIERLFDG
ncbi:MAG: XTP/dITP diphosphatase [Candidatus Poribacteria bacterium]|nr:XTP/dITP diphosphatase [Candidatus Poribacteria bacterium]